MRRLLTIILVTVFFLSLTRFYTRFKAYAAPIPPGVHLAGLELSALKKPTEIRKHLEAIYREPVAVYFAGERLWLDPEDIGFRLDVDAMVREASRYLDGPDFVDIALREAVGLPQQIRNVEVQYTIDPAKVRDWLNDIAAEYNRGPQPARVMPPTNRWGDGSEGMGSVPLGFVGSYSRGWQWTPGGPGYALDMQASVPAILNALTSQEKREIHLSLIETPASSPSMQDLTMALDSYTSSFPGFAAIYVHDLTTGEEAVVDADVTFSGMSTMKLAIVAAVMQRLQNGFQAGDNESFEIGQWIDFALGESNNYAANLLIQWLGDGNSTAGAAYVTNFARQLGLVSTYMLSGYDARAQLPQIPTPGNQRDDWHTNPDSNLQTTPREIGEILVAIWECSQGRGLLLETFPNDFTAEECQHLLFYLSHDHFQELLWSGLPDPNNAWVLHKHGFAYESHSDAAIIWGPTGPYVLSVFLYRSGWLDWGNSNGTMKGISEITWNFFDLRAQYAEDGPGDPPDLPPPPVYVPVNNYVPAS